MKALCFDKNVKFVADYPRPKPGPSEALIKVKLAGICRTDLEITQGYMKFKGVMGHEFVGVVAECANREWINKRVTSEINFSCGECVFCRNNMPGHCTARTVMGLDRHDGCFAEYIAVPAVNLHLVPDSITDEEATFIEPLAACFQIMEQVHIKPNSNVIVLGAGKLGLLVAQVMRLQCTEVLLVAKYPAQQKVAQALGINTVLLSKVRGRSRMVVDCTGSPEGFLLAQQLVIPRGTIVLKSTFQQDASFKMAPLVVNEITVTGSRCGPFQPAINALARKYISVKPLVAARYDLSDGIKAFAKAREDGALKILLNISK